MPNPRRGAVLRLLLILLAVLALLGLGLVLFVDHLAVLAVSRGGSYALGVPTSLNSASIGLVSGRFGLEGLEVQNPTGYDKPLFLDLDRASMDAGLTRLLSDTLEIQRVEIEGVEISLERKNGKTNYDAILDHLKSLSGGAGSAPKTGGEQGTSKKFVIHKLVLKDITAHIALVPMVGGQTVHLSSIEIDDLGNSGSAASLSAVFERLVGELLAGVMNSAGDLIPADLSRNLKSSLGELGSISKETLEGAAKKLEQAGKDLEKGAQDLKKGLEGLFGK